VASDNAEAGIAAHSLPGALVSLPCTVVSRADGAKKGFVVDAFESGVLRLLLPALAACSLKNIGFGPSTRSVL